MKEIKIALSGEKEEQIAQHIMKSVYEAINEHCMTGWAASVRKAPPIIWQR